MLHLRKAAGLDTGLRYDMIERGSAEILWSVRLTGTSLHQIVSRLDNIKQQPSVFHLAVERPPDGLCLLYACKRDKDSS